MLRARAVWLLDYSPYGDVSSKGLQQSAGLMVNYLYRQGDIESNHEAYRDEGLVAASSAVRSVARG